MFINILIIILGIILVAAIAFALLLKRNMFTATKGEMIADYPSPHSALLVIDIQQGYNGDESALPPAAAASSGLIGVINRLIDAAQSRGVEVVYIRQVFKSNIFVRLHGGKNFDKVIVDRRVKKINSNDFEKSRTDAFASRDFEEFLIKNSINELYLTGVDAAYCVYYTALGAINRGYKTTIVIDATASRKDRESIQKLYSSKGITTVTAEELWHKLKN